MELATGTEIGNEKSYCKGKNDSIAVSYQSDECEP
jgi:hypothetical protein